MKACKRCGRMMFWYTKTKARRQLEASCLHYAERAASARRLYEAGYVKEAADVYESAGTIFEHMVRVIAMQLGGLCGDEHCCAKEVARG